MNHDDVLLVGVFDPDGNDEGFCYSTNAPTNLWVGALCSDGSRMSHEFMAYVLNELIDADCFGAGDFADLRNQDGKGLIATVGAKVPKRSVQAFAAVGPTVRVVTVEVVAPPPRKEST